MSRPAKAASTLAGNQTIDEKAAREAVESALRGDAEKLAPPEWLSKDQAIIFNFVVDELAASGILGNLDVYVLAQFSAATERLMVIEKVLGDSAESLIVNKELIAARSAYMKDFWRGVNELSLSPQARAKIGTLNLTQKKEAADPLRKLLAGKGGGMSG